MFFFNEIDRSNNIFFKSVQEFSKNKISFDYLFISTGANSINKEFINFLDIKKSYNQSCLTFKVLLRGNLETQGVANRKKRRSLYGTKKGK